jgi:hypothetical protein
VVSFIPQPLYSQGKSSRYALDRRLGGPQEPVWTTWRSENSYTHRDSNLDLLVVQPVASRYTDCVIPALGEDAITADLIQGNGRCLWKSTYQLIVSVWESEIMPEEWQTAVICLICKNGNKLACENYKGTTLLDVVYKIFTDVLAWRIKMIY